MFVAEPLQPPRVLPQPKAALGHRNLNRRVGNPGLLCPYGRALHCKPTLTKGRKKKAPSIGEFETQGCWAPSVTRFTSSPT
jgi:hypothetical protein